MLDPVAIVWAPLAVGLLLFLLAEGTRLWWTSVNDRRRRRRKIISLMGRAVALQARAIDDGLFDQAHIANSDRALAKARRKYDDLTAQALDLFEVGEEVVAFWTATEFYAGWYSPLEILTAMGVPRAARADGMPLVSTNDLGRGWMLARPQMLASWAQVRFPWDRGNARGPRYADLFTVGDTTRHPIVIPNSDANMDMLRPFVLYLPSRKQGPFDSPSKKESKRLQREFGSGNESHASYRAELIGRSTPDFR